MLTSEQEAIVRSPNEDAIVLAGAGSGKTTVIVERTLELIRRGIPASSIMVITFTKKAAREVKERLHNFAKNIAVGTFHSICLRALRASGTKLYPVSNEQSLHLLDEAAVLCGLAVKNSRGSIKYQKRSRAYWQKNLSENRQLEQIFLSMLQRQGAIDYQRLVEKGRQIAQLGSNPVFSNVRYLLVDEAQDTSQTQWDIVFALQDQGAKVMLVGDLAQNLFTFAGAKPEVVERLGWKQYEITQTFRSPSQHTQLANALPVKKVQLRPVSDLGRVVVSSTPAAKCVMQCLREQIWSPEEIAVLCRYNQDVDLIKSQLQMLGIPTRNNPKAEESRPVKTLLLALEHPGSAAARDALRRCWPAGPQPGPVEWLTSSISDSACRWLVNNWLESLGASWGPSEILRAIDMPRAFASESEAILRLYGGTTLEHFALEETSLDPILDTVSKGVNVDTIHSSKGGQWPVVILPGLCQWPRKDAKEEEWRAAYVAVTRSQDSLYLLHDGEPGPIIQIYKGLQKNGAMQTAQAVDRS